MTKLDNGETNFVAFISVEPLYIGDQKLWRWY